MNYYQPRWHLSWKMFYWWAFFFIGGIGSYWINPTFGAHFATCAVGWTFHAFHKNYLITPAVQLFVIGIAYLVGLKWL